MYEKLQRLPVNLCLARAQTNVQQLWAWDRSELMHIFV